MPDDAAPSTLTWRSSTNMSWSAGSCKCDITASYAAADGFRRPWEACVCAQHGHETRAQTHTHAATDDNRQTHSDESRCSRQHGSLRRGIRSQAFKCIVCYFMCRHSNDPLLCLKTGHSSFPLCSGKVTQQLFEHSNKQRRADWAAAAAAADEGVLLPSAAATAAAAASPGGVASARCACAPASALCRIQRSTAYNATTEVSPRSTHTWCAQGGTAAAAGAE